MTSPTAPPYTYAATILGADKRYLLVDVDLGFGTWLYNRPFLPVAGQGHRPAAGDRVLLTSVKCGTGRTTTFRARFAPLDRKPPYTYNATITRVIDGDTVTAAVDLGFNIWFGSWSGMGGKDDDWSYRLFGCNARELHGPGGKEARENLLTLLPPGSQHLMRSVKPDKYGGRSDASFTLPDGSDLVTALITAGWVAAWDGVGPKPMPDWPRKLIGA